ncbi:MAG: SUMF1/EgtB/PvdO family nonheme iron enzyme [Paludibacteraceae bacterium]|nr:SUMF1/EgtB/PvdO family nonheme iron enzyme [Paludibacteraceae bacterium]
MKCDVFISSKREDYDLAEQISAFLRKNGLNPFLASESLRRIGNAAYLDEIDQALEECNHLIVFCTKPEYAGSEYVKEEWQSFRNEKLSGRKSGNILTVVADTVSVGQLPFGLHRYEVIKFSDYRHVLLDYLDNERGKSPSHNSVTNFNFNTEEKKKSLLFKVKDVEFKMIYVEGGKFKMGANNGNSDEKPVHDVILDDYFIGETVVTQALWKAVMGKKTSYFQCGNRPVDKVSWNDCQTFIRRLNKCTQEQLKGCSFALPTEAQWEFAARGGKKSKGYFYSGSNTLDDVAWHGGKTHTVKRKEENELELYDMSGNVWEWCQDWYGSYPSSPQTNPTGPSSGSSRVIRGGGRYLDAGSYSSALRGRTVPIDRSCGIGLRLVLLF